MEEQHHGQRIWQWLLEGKRHGGAKHTLHFKPFLYIMKPIILPRQARDKQTVGNPWLRTKGVFCRTMGATFERRLNRCEKRTFCNTILYSK
jgi:hypothetical protein